MFKTAPCEPWMLFRFAANLFNVFLITHFSKRVSMYAKQMAYFFCVIYYVAIIFVFVSILLSLFVVLMSCYGLSYYALYVVG